MKSCCSRRKKHYHFISAIFFAIALAGSVLLIMRISYAGISINTNVASITARQQLQRTQMDLGKSFERLSSGLRINKAADDAAGLAISERFRMSIQSMSQAERNTADGISLTQTVEGGFAEISGVLQRIKELSVQQATDQNITQDASMRNIQQEASSLVQQINSIMASGFGITVQQPVSAKKLKICKKTKKAKKAKKMKSNAPKISSANLSTWNSLKEKVSQVVSGATSDAASFFGLQSAQGTISLDEFSSSIDSNIALINSSAQEVIDAVTKIDEDAQDVLDEADEVYAEFEDWAEENGINIEDDDLEDIDITTVDTTPDAIDRLDAGLSPPRPITAGIETKFQKFDEGNGAATLSLVFKITDPSLLQMGINGFSFSPEGQSPPLTGLYYKTFKLNDGNWSENNASCPTYVPNSPLNCAFSAPLQPNKYNVIGLSFQGLGSENRYSLYLDLTSNGSPVGRIFLPFRPEE